MSFTLENMHTVYKKKATHLPRERVRDFIFAMALMRYNFNHHWRSLALKKSGEKRLYVKLQLSTIWATVFYFFFFLHFNLHCVCLTNPSCTLYWIFGCFFILLFYHSFSYIRKYKNSTNQQMRAFQFHWIDEE